MWSVSLPLALNLSNSSHWPTYAQRHTQSQHRDVYCISTSTAITSFLHSTLNGKCHSQLHDVYDFGLENKLKAKSPHATEWTQTDISDGSAILKKGKNTFLIGCFIQETKGNDVCLFSIVWNWWSTYRCKHCVYFLQILSPVHMPCSSLVNWWPNSPSWILIFLMRI